MRRSIISDNFRCLKMFSFALREVKEGPRKICVFKEHEVRGKHRVLHMRNLILWRIDPLLRGDSVKTPVAMERPQLTCAR
jgi:hypothetical protein